MKSCVTRNYISILRFRVCKTFCRLRYVILLRREHADDAEIVQGCRVGGGGGGEGWGGGGFLFYLGGGGGGELENDLYCEQDSDFTELVSVRDTISPGCLDKDRDCSRCSRASARDHHEQIGCNFGDGHGSIADAFMSNI